ncbi:MAG: ribonuclease domain-containing protein [Acidimicrobiales bacterium]
MIVSLAGGDDTTNDNELSSSEVAAEITAGGTATPAEDTSATADDTAVDDTAVDDTAADEAGTNSSRRHPPRRAERQRRGAADRTIQWAPGAGRTADRGDRHARPRRLGRPVPYSQDDSVFQNREGILPDQPQGYYRRRPVYTVVTRARTGDRGARRIVAGTDGDLYYTDDHYDSFREIVLSS